MLLQADKYRTDVDGASSASLLRVRCALALLHSRLGHFKQALQLTNQLLTRFSAHMGLHAMKCDVLFRSGSNMAGLSALAAALPHASEQDGLALVERCCILVSSAAAATNVIDVVEQAFSIASKHFKREQVLLSQFRTALQLRFAATADCLFDQCQ
jgi:hypothetical protein